MEEAFYMSKMEPAIRAYLTTMREEAYVEVAPGYVDTGASPKEIKPVYSAYIAALGQEKEESGTHPLPRNHARLPPEGAASRAPSGRSCRACPDG